MSRPRLVVTRRLPVPVLERIKAEFEAIVPDTDLDAGMTLAAIRGIRADALLLTPKLRLDADFIASLPDHLRVAATCSVGFDHIDVATAQARGLVVTNTPDVLTEATADLAFLLILAAARRAGEYTAIMRAGWRRSFGLDEMLGVDVGGRTLGILGMGRIGQAVARRARGFNMPILYCNRHRLPPQLEQGARYFADLHAMLPHCQILSLHAPASRDTEGLMNADAFARLPRGAIFVNTARGALVDEEALIDAVRSGHLFAAGLDVFRCEPDFDRRLAELPNLILTPHVASATLETRTAMGFRALDNIAAVCAGQTPRDPLWP